MNFFFPFRISVSLAHKSTATIAKFGFRVTRRKIIIPPLPAHICFREIFSRNWIYQSSAWHSGAFPHHTLEVFQPRSPTSLLLFRSPGWTGGNETKSTLALMQYLGQQPAKRHPRVPPCSLTCFLVPPDSQGSWTQRVLKGAGRKCYRVTDDLWRPCRVEGHKEEETNSTQEDWIKNPGGQKWTS